MMFITLYIYQNIKCNHKTRAAQKDVFSYLEMRSDLVLGFEVQPLLLSLQITTIISRDATMYYIRRKVC